MQKKMLPLLLVCALLQSCMAQTRPLESSNSQASPSARPATAETPASAKPSPQPVVCIDPGHPSETSAGNVVQNGTTEVHIVWVVGLKLKTLLEAAGIQVVMTKESESQMVTNKARAEIANRAKADLMIRLHCDASTDTGYAVYAPDRQGRAQNVTGPSAGVIERSRAAARVVHQGIKSILDGILKDGGVRGDSRTLVGGRQGALTGSIFSEVPVVLIEMVVLSNRQDADFIKSEAGQEKMAQAIAEGIRRFLIKS